MKIKYWSATYNSGVSGSRPFLTTTGQPCFTKRDAIAHAKTMHSSNAVVVRADAKESPTTDVVWAVKLPA